MFSTASRQTWPHVQNTPNMAHSTALSTSASSNTSRAAAGSGRGVCVCVCVCVDGGEPNRRAASCAALERACPGPSCTLPWAAWCSVHSRTAPFIPTRLAPQLHGGGAQVARRSQVHAPPRGDAAGERNLGHARVGAAGGGGGGGPPPPGKGAMGPPRGPPGGGRGGGGGGGGGDSAQARVRWAAPSFPQTGQQQPRATARARQQPAGGQSRRAWPPPAAHLRGAPASAPVPVMTLSTPGGRPTSAAMPASSSEVREASSLGLTTQQLPAASAGATFHATISTGVCVCGGGSGGLG
jgi:hypothetical protein